MKEVEILFFIGAGSLAIFWFVLLPLFDRYLKRGDKPKIHGGRPRK